jgi:hypothetical protein
MLVTLVKKINMVKLFENLGSQPQYCKIKYFQYKNLVFFSLTIVPRKIVLCVFLYNHLLFFHTLKKMVDEFSVVIL